MKEFNLKSLQTDGYAVIKNLLSNEDIEHIRQDYEIKKSAALAGGISNGNYNVLSGSKHCIDSKIAEVLKELHKQTDLTVDFIKPSSMYWDTTLAGFGFHCDHESYYHWQDAYNSLNFWIPIIKPSTTELGLRIVPHSKLLEVCPDVTANHIIGKGALRFFKIDNNTWDLHDDENGNIHRLDVNFSKIAVVPEVGVGDAIVMRGDCIHKTNGRDGYRVAASIVCSNSKKILKKDQFVGGCHKKHSMIQHNPSEWSRILHEFGNSNELVLGTVYPPSWTIQL